jgi:hypothetical protein
MIDDNEAKLKAQENRILEVRVGSHLFGTDNEDSDLDLFGVYMPWDGLVYGSGKKEEVDLSKVVKDDTGRNTADAVDRKFHEYRKFVNLLVQNNPNIMHVIMADERNIVFKDDQGFADALFDMGPKFPHKGAYHRFAGYAHAQLKKMRIKPQNYARLELGLEVLDKFDDHMVMADVVKTRKGFQWGDWPFDDHGGGKHIQCGDLFFERGVFVTKVRKAIKERLSKATSRQVLFTKYGYDVKFASNLIQLLKECVELMETGWINMPLAYASDIMAVKDGKYKAEEIEEWSGQLMKEAEFAFENSDLPKYPPAEEIEKFIMCEVWTWSMAHSPWEERLDEPCVGRHVGSSRRCRRRRLHRESSRGPGEGSGSS